MLWPCVVQESVLTCMHECVLYFISNILSRIAHQILTLSQTTNFGLFQTERVRGRQFQIWRKWKNVFQTGRKHWEKEKLLVTSNFSFFHSVFNRLLLQTLNNQGLFGKGLRKLDRNDAAMALFRDCSKNFIPIKNVVAIAVETIKEFSSSKPLSQGLPNVPNFTYLLILTLSQTSPGFYVSAVEVFWKHCGKRRNCS